MRRLAISFLILVTACAGQTFTQAELDDAVDQAVAEAIAPDEDQLGSQTADLIHDLQERTREMSPIDYTLDDDSVSRQLEAQRDTLAEFRGRLSFLLDEYSRRGLMTQEEAATLDWYLGTEYWTSEALVPELEALLLVLEND